MVFSVDTAMKLKLCDIIKKSVPMMLLTERLKMRKFSQGCFNLINGGQHSNITVRY